MVTDEQQCSYEYEHLTETEPDDLVTLSRPANTVQCPHKVPNTDIEACLFHGVDEEYPREKATESFLTALEEGPPQNCFAGAYLPGLDLAGKTITTQDERPIDLRGAIIDGVIDLTDARITVPLILDGASIKRKIKAEDAVFEGAVSLVNSALGKGLHWKGATIEDGIVANSIEAQYVDWRDVTVEGPVTFRDGSFASSLKFSRGEIDGPLVLSGASFDWHIDATMLSVAGSIDASTMDVDGNVDFVGVSTDGSFTIEQARIGGKLECDHTLIGETMQASELTVGESALFEDIRVQAGSVVFDGGNISGKADFGSMEITDGGFSAEGAVFDDELWFTHAEIAHDVEFSNVTLNGPGHLRDALFKGDLLYRNVDDTETTTWMAGSTIEGSLDCTNTAFESFQFTATVEGDADFTGTKYNSRAIFSSSTFKGNVRFDDALFTGTPDFSKSQFTGQVSFTESEFMVEPTFKEARFTSDPALEDAEFLTDISASVQERYRQWQLVFVHPESLENTNLTIDDTAVEPDFSVPVPLTHLAKEIPRKTKTFIDALSKIESQDWHHVIGDALQIARTGATHLDNQTSGWLVFGFEFGNAEEEPSEFLQTAQVVGVYERDDEGFQFTHFAQTLADLDYLVPVPTIDENFEAGPDVATSSELRKAMIRHERFRFREYLEDNPPKENSFSVPRSLVPVFLGAHKS